jgi:diacylglycerol kinase (ATP)
MTSPEIGAIVNPVSGDGSGIAMLQALGDIVGIVDANVTNSRDDVTEATQNLGETKDLLAIVGGDGTVRDVTEALQTMANPPPVFVVPAGRGNSTYRHLYGDTPWQDLAREIASDSQIRSVEAGRVRAGDRSWLFMLGFSMGIFEAGVNLAERLRFLPGKLAYVFGTTAAALSQSPFPIRIEREAETVFEGRANLAAVGGGRYRGSSFALLPESRPGDETLHLLIMEPTEVQSYPRLLRMARSGDHVNHPAVTYRKGTKFDFSTDGVGAEVDGTPIGTGGEVGIDVMPGALEVAYPAGQALWDHGEQSKP